MAPEKNPFSMTDLWADRPDNLWYAANSGEQLVNSEC